MQKVESLVKLSQIGRNLQKIMVFNHEI